ncbi:MAG TPA: Crp/Fnr family transcriptional regulator [Acetobacteraceae bacterium]|jgi:CRP-like cAMP-binding protein|nr:Crp/Fnr family transcriptional regulator [Acetobacteraceae bacterium]
MESAPNGALLRKLASLGPLTPAERQLLEELPLSTRHVGPDEDLLREGDRPTQCFVLLEGFACRYKTLADGRRQILSFNIAGDFVDLPGFLLDQLDHGIATLTACKISAIPHSVIAEWALHPNLLRLLWRDTLIDGAIYREWVLNVGRRTAYQRVAHVLCELATRLQAVGLGHNGVCELPITQGELADATGLSTVHVNRVIQELRRDALIEMKGRAFSALDWDGLKLAAGFDPSYLNLPALARERRGQLV